MTEKDKHTVTPKTFILAWACLLILTGLTILAARVDLGAWSMFANLLIASTKASLVLWFFMHLKYETRFFKFLILIPIATVTVIIWLTFFDIWYRQ